MSISSAINNALSGAQAATESFRNSANNVANLRSVAAPANEGPIPPVGGRPATNEAGEPIFRPGRTDTVTQTGGGVLSQTSLLSPSSFAVYNPDAADADENGISSLPNVSLESEATGQIQARRQLEANLAVIRTADELSEETLDILA